MGLISKLTALRQRPLTGIEEQLRLIHKALRETVAGLDNQQRVLNDKLGDLVGAVSRTNPGIPHTSKTQAQTLDTLLDTIRASATSPQDAAKVFDRVLREVVRPHHHGIFWGDRLLTLDKSADFRDEEPFQAALKQADSSTGANQYESPDGISWRYNTLIWAAKTCLRLPGDFVECGVFRGDMTWMITEMVDLQSAGKRFYLYDTFAGQDPKYSSPDDFPDSGDFFNFINREYKSPGIETHVRQRFSDKPFVIVTKGIVPDILHEIVPPQIAFLHLDMNSPRAETAALEFLFDRISPGGCIIFDDYGWKQYRKQKETADRTMANRGRVILELPTGQGLVVKT